jgi:GntR family transcriptional regulator
MFVKIDFRSKKPLVLQIQSAIKSQIASGSLLPGDQLLTVRELANQLEINFNTVARAYRVLDQEGWITTRQGRGTFALEAQEEADDRDQIETEPVDAFIRSTLMEAAKLGLTKQQLCEAIEKASNQREITRAGPRKRKLLSGLNKSRNPISILPVNRITRKKNRTRIKKT